MSAEQNQPKRKTNVEFAGLSNSERVTSRHIAKAAGVSQTTVSRVLSGSNLVTPDTRARVMQVLEEYGYQPNAIAQAMVTGRTSTIGVVVDGITNPFYPELLEAIANAMEGSGYRMTLWSSGAASEPAAIEAISQRLVDGIIFTGAVADSPALQEATKGEAPLVLLNRYVDGVRCDTVTTDNVSGGRAAAEHLLSLGHRSLGVIGAAPDLSTAREREQGFREALAAHGLEPWIDRGQPSFHLGWEALQELATMPERPTAVFCMNDITAFGVLSAAQRFGLSVPGDLSVLGFDDIDMAQWETFNLTTVRQPIVEMAQNAVRLLQERIEDPTRKPRHRCLEARVILRDTTGAPGARSGRS
ncbi:LacI family DNA-binding transcriptional regulator [Baekduia alba]|uniref:LacI family DNA-binding transcriptional regulator n=1 Tax=Baekduia alba TaxID=2997333 RepID=UPI0023405CB7|nr:LacI family DNA-binding transcriptional regulator [Baekduia alba]